METFSPEYNSQTVLVVEDDVDLCEMLTVILSGEGWNVKTALNGQVALDLINTGKLPNLILTDMKMPVMDGSELCGRLKSNERTKDVPVIIASGEDDIEAKSKLLGAEAYLHKPYRLKLVSALVNQYRHHVSG